MARLKRCQILFEDWQMKDYICKLAKLLSISYSGAVRHCVNCYIIEHEFNIPIGQEEADLSFEARKKLAK